MNRHPHALTLQEQAVLCVVYGVRWTPNFPDRCIRSKGFIEQGFRCPRGAVKDLARRYVAGEFGEMTYCEAIDAERQRLRAAGLPDIAFSDQALKNAIWKYRTGYNERGKRRSARRVAA